MLTFLIYISSSASFPTPVAVGPWTFSGHTRNVRHPTWPTVERNVTFEAIDGYYPNSVGVLSLRGHINSYVELKNIDGGLEVTSFTWAAKLYPRDQAEGPLFHWVSNDVATNER